MNNDLNAQRDGNANPNPIIGLNESRLKTFKQLGEEGGQLSNLKQIWGCYVLEESINLFPSERGTGKTYLMMQLALMIASKAETFLGEPIELHGNVLFINLELGENLISRRVHKLEQFFPAETDERYNVHCLTFKGHISKKMQEIESLIEKLNPVLVIIDNLRAASSDINNERNNEVTQFLQNLQAIKDNYKFSYILVHHTKKNSNFGLTNSDMQSGAGALTDLVDGDFFLRKSSQDKNQRLLKRAKSRECESQEGAKLILMDPDTLWFELIEEKVKEWDYLKFQNIKEESIEETNEMRVMRAEGKSLKEIGEHFNLHKSNVSRRLNKS